jgi:hypothetical protein
MFFILPQFVLYVNTLFSNCSLTIPASIGYSSAILNMNMFSRKTVVAAGQIDKDYMMRNASGRFSLSKVPY